MILLDTNVLIYADDHTSPFHSWSRQLIAETASVEEAVANPITIAELCVGEDNPSQVIARLQTWGILLADLPVSTAIICAQSYRQYRNRRTSESGKPSPVTPLPDFFIGAHAAVMGWDIATADAGRFKTYFPDVILHLPEP